MATSPKPTLVILAAGTGSRLGESSRYLHKALLCLDRRAVLSHILERFPADWPVVIAVGHLAEQVRDYAQIAHPERQMRFVEIAGYRDPGSGPGASLLQCRESIPGSFYFIAVDTILCAPRPERGGNWLGVGPIAEPGDYCTVLVDNAGRVTSLLDKDPASPSRLAFAGLARIEATDTFWRALETSKSLPRGEKQVSPGLEALVPLGLHAVPLDWLDTGSPAGLLAARRRLEGDGFDFSKTGEVTYAVGGRAIKWQRDPKSTERRVRRAAKLTGIVPPIDQSRGQFFSYRWIEGQVGYLALDTFRFEDLLSWLDRYLWVTPQAVDPGAFREACLAFYREKTLARIRAFLEKSPDSDRPERINGSPVRSVSELISRVDWNGIADHAIASAFHGDLQLDNLIVHPGVGNGFTLIDWREDFAGLDYGDRYYDLAKLNGGLHLDYHRIRDGEPLPFARGADGVRVDDVASGALIRHRDQLHRYCTERRLDLRHIELLTSLIFLNMAPLHHSPFDHFLWNLGQWKLSCCLQEETP